MKLKASKVGMILLITVVLFSLSFTAGFYYCKRYEESKRKIISASDVCFWSLLLLERSESKQYKEFADRILDRNATVLAREMAKNPKACDRGSYNLLVKIRQRRENFVRAYALSEDDKRNIERIINEALEQWSYHNRQPCELMKKNGCAPRGGVLTLFL